MRVALLLVVFSCGRSGLDVVATQQPVPLAAIAPLEANRILRTTVALDGSGSTDPLQQPLAFNWRIVSRPAGSVAGIESPNQMISRLTPDALGDWAIELTVSSGQRVSAPVTTTLHVSLAPISNRPPQAKVGAPIVVRRGEKVTLDGTGSIDPDGDPLTYQWELGTTPSSAVLEASDQSRAYFTPSAVGEFSISLTVKDPAGLFDAVFALVTVVAAPAQVDGGLTASGLFSPSEVYIDGTLSEGACDRDALAHWADPNTASTGFDCYFSGQTAVIRPTDGRLVYVNINDFKVREYHCDTCVMTTPSPYPEQVLKNDPILPTPCPNAEPVVSEFRVSADGALFYRCQYDNSNWRDATGAVVYDATPGRLLTVGLDGWALTTTGVVKLGTGQKNAFTGLITSSNDWLTARWLSSGVFGVAVTVGANTQLWRIATTGVATLVGTYPYSMGTQISPKLDGDGRLFTMGYPNDTILRREVGGSADIVYDEKTNPLVKLHISYLVTGP